MAVVVTYNAGTNTITITGGTEGTPATFADIQAANDAGGWGVCSNPFTGCYKLDAHLQIGDGVITTWLQTYLETIIMPNDQPQVKANSNFVIGAKSTYAGSNYSGYGTFLNFKAKYNSHYFCDGGNIYIYGSTIHYRDTHLLFKTGNVYLYDSLISSDSITNALIFCETMSGDTISNLYVYNTRDISIRSTNIITNKISIENSLRGTTAYNGLLTTIDLLVMNFNSSDVFVQDGYAILVNPRFHISSPVNWSDRDWIKEQYTCNIHIADKDGNDLASANVDCEYAHLVEGSDGKTYKCIQDHTAVDAVHKPITGSDWTNYWELYDETVNPTPQIGGDWNTGFDYKGGATEFATQTTDADGNITELIQYKKWVGTSETCEARLHKFTISKSGYETLVKDNITVDKPIDWHLELLPELAETDVRKAVSFGEGKVGTLDLPSVNDVEKGVQFDNLTKTGTLKVPAEVDVRQGEGYGANNNEFTGKLELPNEDDVEKSVKYDSETKEGSFEAPAEADVKKGVGYGANGIEFEGDYEADFPAEEDVEKDVAYDEGVKVGKFHVPAEEDVEVGVGYGANGTEFEGTYLGLKGDNLVAYLQKSVDLVGYLENKVSLTGELRS